MLVAAVLLLALPATVFAWGEVFVPASSWNGVDVYSNSPAPDPYYSQGDSGWGWRWQCVELAQRLYNQKGWVGATHWPVDYAYQMYDVAPGLGLTRQDNGSITAPAWGDLVIWLGERATPTSEDTGGHVAVVTAVSGSSVTIVEQNGLAAERGTRTINLSSGTLSDGRGEIRGIIKCPGSPPSAPTGQIAFVRDGDIWVMDADGGNARRLTTSAKAEGNPTWSPDGSTIAYIRGEGSQSQIWLMNADGTTPRRMPFTLNAQTMPGTNRRGTSRMIDEMAWSPSGADIAVCAFAYTFDVPGGIFNDQLYLVHPDGTGQRRIGPLIGGNYGGVQGLSWRPDGAQLLLSERFRQGGGRAVIYHVGSKKISVPFPSEYGGRTMWNAVWSPDGRQIAACVQDNPDQYMGPMHVAIIDMRTREEHALRITAQSQSQLIQPTWSPDGHWLACSSPDGGAEVPDTFLLSADGTESRFFMANAADPAWKPTASPPTPTPTVTLALAGLTAGAMRLGQVVTASGAVTALGLAGSRVTLTVQMKKGVTWAKLKTTSASISPKGNYSWKFTPALKGAYRMRATIAKTGVNPAATTPWRAFAVK
jgi:Tol biopolymer transport system component